MHHVKNNTSPVFKASEYTGVLSMVMIQSFKEKSKYYKVYNIQGFSHYFNEDVINLLCIIVDQYIIDVLININMDASILSICILNHCVL